MKPSPAETIPLMGEYTSTTRTASSVDSYGLTNLHRAAEYNDTVYIKTWLNQYEPPRRFKDLQRKSNRGYNVMHYAMWRGTPETLELLLTGLGIKHITKLFQAEEDQGATPLFVGVASRNSKAITALFSRPDFTPPLISKLERAKTKTGWGLLHHSLCWGDAPVIRALFTPKLTSEQKVETWLTIGEKTTPLHEATNGHQENMETMLGFFTAEEAERLFQAESQGVIPLYAAALMGKANIVGILLSPTWVPLPQKRIGFLKTKTKKGGDTPLHAAASKGFVAAIEALLKTEGLTPPIKHELISAKNNKGNNSLHMAAISGNADALRALVRAGELDRQQLINLMYDKNNDGHTAIHVAAYNGNIDFIILLFELAHLTPIDRMPFLNNLGNLGETPLHLAAGKDHTETVIGLLTLEGSTIEQTLELLRVKGQSDYCCYQTARETAVSQGYQNTASLLAIFEGLCTLFMTNQNAYSRQLGTLFLELPEGKPQLTPTHPSPLMTGNATANQAIPVPSPSLAPEPSMLLRH